ncbi:MAG: FAD:protein FMN transferase [Anaerolineae bacterium]|nr:FAD:protein FMN transferase [Anaerolineae bacterium]
MEAGGDFGGTAGARADGAPWQVGITHPRHADQGDILSVLSLLTRAVATSGDYMNAFTADFSEHHIIDPRTGSSPLGACQRNGSSGYRPGRRCPQHDDDGAWR